MKIIENQESVILAGAKVFTIGKDTYEYKSEDKDGQFFGRLIRIANRARAGFKSEFNYRFNSDESRTKYFESVIKAKQDSATKASAKSDRVKLLKEAFRKDPTVKAGDVFYDSWGYEQTNIDYYQVVAVKGLSVTFRRIAASIKEDSFMSGNKVAKINEFTSEDIVKVVQFRYKDEPTFTSDFGSISRVDEAQLVRGINCSWYN